MAQMMGSVFPMYANVTRELSAGYYHFPPKNLIAKL